MQKGVALSLLLLCSACVPVSNGNHSERLDEQEESWMQVRDEVDYVKHEQGNVFSEIRMFESRLATQESMIDSSRRELSDIVKRDQEHLNRNISDFGGRLSTMERQVEGMVEDLRSLKTHANDTAASLGQAKQRIRSMEQTVDSQRETVRSLEGAVRALMALVESGAGSDSSQLVAENSHHYKVRSGDTLEKIAQSNGTSVKALKSANDLKSDLIRVGQTLKLP